MVLYKIVNECRRLENEFRWGYQFKWDQGDFETKIEDPETGDFFCPDVVDVHNKIIIEHEEEAKANTGYHKAKKHRGHTDYTNTRDRKRDAFYKKLGFEVLKIWESDKQWKTKLKQFLVNHYTSVKIESLRQRKHGVPL